MKLGIVSGSHRPDSESGRIAAGIAARWKGPTFLRDLGKDPLPFWDEGIWKQSPAWAAAWAPVTKDLSTCEALIFVTPEWNGMATPQLHNFFQLCGGASGPIAHKAALIVTVSSTSSGSYPVSELRGFSSKNTRVCYIPEHLIVRNAGRFLKEDTEETRYISSRLDYCLRLLQEYARALTTVRSSGAIDPEKYPFGM